jgi:hypothetical protein
MPACTICGVRIRGLGSRCAQHRYTGRRYDEYNYSSDSTDPRSTYHRTGTGTRARHAHFADNQDIYGQYDISNALVRYRTHGNAHQSISHPNELAKPLVHVFDRFSNSHAIASVQYSANPSSGDYSLSAQANLDREQCTNCLQWFPDRLKLQYHQQEFPVECEQCNVCLRGDNIAYHATNVEHDRCFVRTCGSDYRRLGNWKHRYVERHVLARHY